MMEDTPNYWNHRSPLDNTVHLEPEYMRISQQPHGTSHYTTITRYDSHYTTLTLQYSGPTHPILASPNPAAPTPSAPITGGRSPSPPTVAAAKTGIPPIMMDIGSTPLQLLLHTAYWFRIMSLQALIGLAKPCG